MNRMSVMNIRIVCLALVAVAASLVTGYITTQPSQKQKQPAFGVRRSILSSTTSLYNDNNLHTTTQSSIIDHEVESFALHINTPTITTTTTTTTTTDIRQAESQYQMPWKQSIDPKAFVNEELLYMPFWRYQMKFLVENLTDLKVVACTNDNTDFTYNENTSKKARIVNLCLSSKEYRKIRLTYYDAGDNTQVFNAVLYPRSNLPILGIDLLAFNRKKYLAIVDFQPLHTTESHHAREFTHLLQPIKDMYPNLKGRMSSKFYDETQYFSQQMLFSRFEDESIIQKELFPAFQQYVSTHLDLVRSVEDATTTTSTTTKIDTQLVLQHQKAYDTYSAARDPATGLFTAMFGEEWAMDYVHDFLFSMSDRPDVSSVVVVTPQQQSVTGASKNPYAATTTAASSSPTPVGNKNPYVSSQQQQQQRQPQLASVSI